MNNCAYLLSSTTYKNHVFEGFSRLQQNDEFVDMTLGADGHWVKVHRILVALASPYFRELLQSLPCQHPVMYLYGVSHEALGFILEYLYTGQVDVPAEKVQSFLNTAKDMQLAGLKNVVPPEGKVGNREETKHDVFTSSRKAPSTARVYHTTNNKDSTDFGLYVPSIVIPVKENKNSSSHMNVPIPLVGCNTFQNPNVILEKSAAANGINQNFRSNEFLNIRNAFTPNSVININVGEPVSDTDINQGSGSNELQNITDINLSNDSNDIINETFEKPADTNDTNQELTSTEFPNISNINAPSKTINITLGESASNGSNKPVANIEILSNTLISKTQGQLPELYTEALAKIYSQNTTHNKSKPQCTTSSNRSLMDISQLLDFRDDVQMDEDHDSDWMETSAQRRNNEEIPVNRNTTNNIQSDETVLLDTDSTVYTLSNRGALQLIMNRFMYYCQYKRDNGRKRRWRCIDYRDKKCLAAIDTDGEHIVERKHKHCHPNHEERIKRKMTLKKLRCFASIQMAEAFIKEKK